MHKALNIYYHSYMIGRDIIRWNSWRISRQFVPPIMQMVNDCICSTDQTTNRWLVVLDIGQPVITTSKKYFFNSFRLRDGVKKSKWKFKMAFAIRGLPPPPPLWQNFQTFVYPTFFLLQLNPTYMKRIIHFKNITFKSSYNWFKIDIHRRLRPLTANYWAMFEVISTTIYT